MVTMAKVSRVLVNSTCLRGRKRVSRTAVMLLVAGILLVGLRQAYKELSQQNEQDVVKKSRLESVGGGAQKDRGELLVEVSSNVDCVWSNLHIQLVPQNS